MAPEQVSSPPPSSCHPDGFARDTTWAAPVRDFPADKGPGSPFWRRPLAFQCRVGATRQPGRGEGRSGPFTPVGLLELLSFKCRKLCCGQVRAFHFASGFSPSNERTNERTNGLLPLPHPQAAACKGQAGGRGGREEVGGGWISEKLSSSGAKRVPLPSLTPLIHVRITVGEADVSPDVSLARCAARRGAGRGRQEGEPSQRGNAKQTISGAFKCLGHTRARGL